MKFRRQLFNRVKCDAGFSVKIRVMSGYVEYRDGQRVATSPVELMMGKAYVSVDANTSVKWKLPYAAEPISEENRKEIWRGESR